MTENEAIKKLNMLDEALNFQRADADESSCALQIAIQALEEIQQYRAIGTVKEIKIREAQFARLSEGYLNDLTLLREYQAIGTIEEFKDLKEKNEPKKPIIRPWSDARCPSCGCSLSESLGDGYYKHFESLERCDECNQKLDWQ